MEIDIKGEHLKFEINSVWAVVYDFETLTDKKIAFDLSNTMAVHIAMYGILARCNPSLTLSIEDFILELNNIALAKAMTEYFMQRMKVLTQSEEIRAEVEGKKPKEEGDKKKEATTAPTECTKRRSEGMGWIRRIFLGLWELLKLPIT